MTLTRDEQPSEEPYWVSRNRHNAVCLLILFGPLVFILLLAVCI